MNVQQKTKGFTIIEVVLVLAIAALIFLLVFLALPALQRSQRDTQRRNDLGRATAAMQTWLSNNNGNLPTDADMQTGSPSPFVKYLRAGGSTFADPSGGNYTFNKGAAGTNPTSLGASSPSNTTDGKLTYYRNVDCQNNTKQTAMAIIGELENGGTYCVNN